MPYSTVVASRRRWLMGHGPNWPQHGATLYCLEARCWPACWPAGLRRSILRHGPDCYCYCYLLEISSAINASNVGPADGHVQLEILVPRYSRWLNYFRRRSDCDASHTSVNAKPNRLILMVASPNTSTHLGNAYSGTANMTPLQMHPRPLYSGYCRPYTLLRNHRPRHLTGHRSTFA